MKSLSQVPHIAYEFRMILCVPLCLVIAKRLPQHSE